jgi:DNA/RNA-binding domain of Phe-tRNA-synthetase-like protein
MDIKISKELSQLCPGAALMVLNYEAEIRESSEELLALLDKTIKDLHACYTMADLPELKHIKDTRTAYRNLGKPPTTYRNAAEAMLRRIVKGNGLYHINNVVEVNNLISITTGYSVGSYDTDCLSGTVE